MCAPMWAIFEHYRKFLKNLRREDDRRIAGLYRNPGSDGRRMGPEEPKKIVSAGDSSQIKKWRRGESNPSRRAKK